MKQTNRNVCREAEAEIRTLTAENERLEAKLAEAEHRVRNPEEAHTLGTALIKLIKSREAEIERLRVVESYWYEVGAALGPSWTPEETVTEKARRVLAEVLRLREDYYHHYEEYEEAQ
jgi:hypothetical protein